VVQLEPQSQQQPPLQHTARHGRITDGAQQDGVVRPDLLEHRVRQHLAGPVPAGRAQVVRSLLDRQVDGGRHDVEDLESLGDDLGTDAVTGDDGETDAAGSHGLTLPT
jgi:hypothetical protein